MTKASYVIWLSILSVLVEEIADLKKIKGVSPLGEFLVHRKKVNHKG